MLSPRLKSDIRRLWDRFWSGGIANPLTAIEQITYLVHLKRLEDLDNQRAIGARETERQYHSIYDIDLKALKRFFSDEQFEALNTRSGDAFRWSNLKQLPSEERLRHVRGPVFDWMKSLEGADERMRDAVFVIPSANLLQGAIEIIDGLFVPSRNQDTLGDIYEMLLGEIAEAGKNGQFRTPRHIIRSMCDLVDPCFNERIADPSCGTAGFLVNAYQHILKSNTSPDILRFGADGTPLHLYGDQLTADQHEALRHNHFYGWDFDRTMVRLGWMNMIQHGIVNPMVSYADTLGSSFNGRLIVNGASGPDAIGEFDVVLANPPFTGSIDKADIGESLQSLDTTKTELLFVDLILQLLRVGGRAAVIVPEGLLFGSTNAHRTLRRKLVQENQLNAVISLPGGVFQPYSGVKTSILVFARGGLTERVWFYKVGDDGYTLTAKRTEQFERNDLWDMTLKYRLRHAAAFPQPAPDFVDGATWRQWQTFDNEARRLHYVQPRFRDVEEESEGEAVAVQELAGLETQKLAEARGWEAEQEELAVNELNLSAGRYKPFALETVYHDPPAQIIRELQELEAQIQIGLTELLTMVEEAK
jgi:type I restriction enzyme M protein